MHSRKLKGKTKTVIEWKRVIKQTINITTKAVIEWKRVLKQTLNGRLIINNEPWEIGTGKKYQ